MYDSVRTARCFCRYEQKVVFEWRSICLIGWQSREYVGGLLRYTRAVIHVQIEVG